jgi:hypothetical protein
MLRQLVQRWSFWLLAVGASLGLLTATPVNCICTPSDHLGLAVHSLLPHRHASDTSEIGPVLRQQQRDRLPTGHAIIADDAAANAPLFVAAGLALLAAYLAILTQPVGRRRSPATGRPTEYLGAPPTTPPRPSLVLA